MDIVLPGLLLSVVFDILSSGLHSSTQSFILLNYQSCLSFSHSPDIPLSKRCALLLPAFLIWLVDMQSVIKMLSRKQLL